MCREECLEGKQHWMNKSGDYKSSFYVDKEKGELFSMTNALFLGPRTNCDDIGEENETENENVLIKYSASPYVLLFVVADGRRRWAWKYGVA